MRIFLRMSAVLALSVAALLINLSCHMEGEPRKIGVLQYVHQPLLDETLRGLLSELKALGLDDGKSYSVITKVADKNAQLCSQIARQYVDERVVAIVAIATPAAQAVASQAKEIPIIFAAITDPLAAKLVMKIDEPGMNITGTSNRWPFEKQIPLISAILPKAKKIGAVWNPGEVNSEAAMRIIRELLKARNLELIEVPIASTADVAAAATSIMDRVDAFLMIPDNTALAATTTLVQVALRSGKPIIGGDLDTVRKGSLATFGYDYFELGRETAQMVKEIVVDGKKPATMAVRYPSHATLIINEKTALQLGVTFPDTLKTLAAEKVQ